MARILLIATHGSEDFQPAAILGPISTRYNPKRPCQNQQPFTKSA